MRHIKYFFLFFFWIDPTLRTFFFLKYRIHKGSSIDARSILRAAASLNCVLSARREVALHFPSARTFSPCSDACTMPLPRTTWPTIQKTDWRKKRFRSDFLPKKKKEKKRKERDGRTSSKTSAILP